MSARNTDTESIASSHGSSQEESWDGFEDEVGVKCLLCSASDLLTISDCLAHMTMDHLFDFNKFRSNNQLGFYDTIKIINYLRSTPIDGCVPVEEDLAGKLPDILSNESLMRPVMEDDRFLCEFDDIVETVAGNDDEQRNMNDLSTDWKARYQQLLQEFHDYKSKVTQHFMDRNDLNMTDLSDTAAVVAPKSKPSSSKEQAELDYYFNSYSFADIHESMLKDRVRTNSYRDFIYDNKHLFADKSVLDVGCGTGILSMFAAKAGARKVYAVDNSHMIDKAQQIVHANGLDSVVECIRGKIEEVLLPEKVDIIISEWMGYCLLYEGMLDSVLVARDRWLKPKTGFLAPNQASIHLAAMDDPEWINERVAYWDNVYGFDMSCMKHFMDDQVIVDYASSGCLASTIATVQTIDCNRVRVAELDFHADFCLTAVRAATIYSFVVWFDIEFNHDSGQVKLVHFSTSPDVEQTHWKQSILLLKQPFEIAEGALITGHLSVCKGKENPRELELDLLYSHAGDVSIKQSYKLN